MGQLGGWRHLRKNRAVGPKAQCIKGRISLISIPDFHLARLFANMPLHGGLHAFRELFPTQLAGTTKARLLFQGNCTNLV
jgi:hypothetical protein